MRSCQYSATFADSSLVSSTLHASPTSLPNHWPPACRTKPANWLMSVCERLVM